MSWKLGGWAASRLSLAIFGLCAAIVPLRSADAITTSPFAALVGRWTGEGVLGFKASKPERVKCRATYILDPASQNELKQTIRCATSSGAIEVISNIKEAGGKLTGHWKETIHNFEGDLTGDVTPKGFRVIVRGADISANMDIVVRGSMQAVEIQFVNSSLIGLSMAMKKG
ncbi:hypothetical protein [Hyphomicrobium sp.]|uniref:hypothetical protein n=1 Tax=Hyphomicrobium sp. TaxID=82 RepID=UPI002BFEB690|nr:hypothetical protein [Hyphomicrobium sp.]HVZ04869.1 hypothetical protein [Hyphomicrobium sp.]